MYAVTDIFDHSSHIAAVRGNDGCVDCHRDPEVARTRESAIACKGCHEGMSVTGSVVKPLPGGIVGFAGGYMDAMHGLCIECHKQTVAEGTIEVGKDFDKCVTCHLERQMPGPPVVNESLLVAGNRPAGDARAGEGGA
jgi:hypothetical protein